MIQPDLVLHKFDIAGKFSMQRSLRAGGGYTTQATNKQGTQARNKKIPADAETLNNRWRGKERAGARRPQFQMMEHCTAKCNSTLWREATIDWFGPFLQSKLFANKNSRYCARSLLTATPLDSPTIGLQCMVVRIHTGTTKKRLNLLVRNAHRHQSS
jgi:hypothetical protein